ncbi:MAG: fimbrillin family protein [Candidatus Cryptobacteroides sp.]
MKKFIYLAVVASLAFASCTKNEVRTVDDTQNRQITFQAVVNKASTKALINGTSYTKDDPSFGTFAYFYGSGESFSSSAKTYIDNAEVKNTTSATSGNAWTTDPAYYWPKQGKLTFYSYSPYTINGTAETPNVTCVISGEGDKGIVIAKWDVDANQTVDVMVADRIDNQTANTSNANSTGWNGVPTVFRHKLAQVVDFKLNTSTDYAKKDGESGKHVAGSKQFFVNEISINSVKHEGKFVSGVKPGDGQSETSIGAWSDLETEKYKSYTWFEQANNASADGESVVANEFKYASSEATSSCPKNGKSSDSSSDLYDIKTNGYLLVRPQLFEDQTISGTPSGETHEYIKFVYTIRTWYGTQTDSGEQPCSDEKVTVYKSLANIHGSTAETKKGWEINKKYTYTLTVGLDQIYWAPSVENWANESIDYSPVI